MSCQSVQKSLSAFADGQISGAEALHVSQHLAHCRECAVLRQDMVRMREMLLNFPVAPVSARLAGQLKVLASKERSRRMATGTFPATCRYYLDRLSLFVDNLMRPLALPLAGGLVSALVLFSVLLPTLNLRHDIQGDVPTAFYTEATVENMPPFGFNYDGTVVELTIDEKGRIIDYHVPHGTLSPEVAANISNMMLFSRFTPATWFGQPTSGKILISFRQSRIVVKG